METDAPQFFQHKETRYNFKLPIYKAQKIRGAWCGNKHHNTLSNKLIVIQRGVVRFEGIRSYVTNPDVKKWTFCPLRLKIYRRTATKVTRTKGAVHQPPWHGWLPEASTQKQKQNGWYILSYVHRGLGGCWCLWIQSRELWLQNQQTEYAKEFYEGILNILQWRQIQR